MHGSLSPRSRASLKTLAYCHVMCASSARVSGLLLTYVRISVGVSARLLGMALISISGKGGVAEMRVDGEQQRVFQGLAMLLMGGMSKRQ